MKITQHKIWQEVLGKCHLFCPKLRRQHLSDGSFPEDMVGQHVLCEA